MSLLRWRSARTSVFLLLLITLSACQLGPAPLRVPENPEPSPTPLLAEVFMRVQLDYLEVEKLDESELLSQALLSLERSIPELRVQLPPEHEGDHFRVLLYEQPLATLAPPATLRALLNELQPLLLNLNQRLPDYSVRHLEQVALLGLMPALDQHSVVLPPTNYAEFNENTQGRFAGVGIVVGMRDEQLTILSVMEDGPAQQAGLATDDRVLRIDGEETSGMSLNAIVQRLRGPIGTSIELDLARDNTELTVTLQRADIEVPSTATLDLPLGEEAASGKLRYVRLRMFQANTSQDLEEHLADLEDVRGLILDMRGNPGGLLREAIRVSDLFLPPNKRIVSTQTNSDLDGFDSHQLLLPSALQEIPLVILVNAESASASEIVSAALQAHQRAIVVGEPTFGKGTVQSVWPVVDDFGLKLTIARYLTPENRSIQDVGVTPNLRLDPLRFSPETVRLRSLQQEPQDGALVLHYLRMPQDAMVLDELPLNEDVLAQDDFVRVAQTLLEQRTTDEPLSQTLQRLHPQLQREAEAEILRQLRQQADLDWALSAPSTADHQLELQLITEQQNTEGMWEEVLSPLRPKRPLRLRVQALNAGDTTLERLLVTTESPQAWLNHLEFPFGRLAPGESESWTHLLPLDEKTPPFWLPVTFRAFAGADQELLTRHVRWSLEPEPVAKLQMELAFRDNGDFHSQGNGDGIPQATETIALPFRLTWQGSDTPEQLIVIAASTEDRLEWLRDRVEFDEVRAGEEIEDHLLVRLPPALADTGRWQIVIFSQRSDQPLWRYQWDGDEAPHSPLVGPTVEPAFVFQADILSTYSTERIWQLQAHDAEGLRDAFWFVNQRQQAYLPLNGVPTSALSVATELEKGQNEIELFVRDRFGLATRLRWFVWRE